MILTESLQKQQDFSVICNKPIFSGKMGRKKFEEEIEKNSFDSVILVKLEKLKSLYSSCYNELLKLKEVEKKATGFLDMEMFSSNKKEIEFLKRRYEEEEDICIKKIDKITKKIKYLSLKIQQDMDKLIQEKKKYLDIINSEDTIIDSKQVKKANDKLTKFDFLFLRSEEIYREIKQYKEYIKNLSLVS